MYTRVYIAIWMYNRACSLHRKYNNIWIRLFGVWGWHIIVLLRKHYLLIRSPRQFWAHWNRDSEAVENREWWHCNGGLISNLTLSSLVSCVLYRHVCLFQIIITCCPGWTAAARKILLVSTSTIDDVTVVVYIRVLTSLPDTPALWPSTHRL